MPTTMATPPMRAATKGDTMPTPTIRPVALATSLAPQEKAMYMPLSVSGHTHTLSGGLNRFKTSRRSSWYKTYATRAPPTGVSTQAETMSSSFAHTMGTLPAASPAPATAPTMEWVVDTGSFRYVAANSHPPAASMAARAMTVDRSESS